MVTSWIDTMIRLNDDIVAADGRVNDQVLRLVEMVHHGEDTTRDEGLLASYVSSLAMLRAIRNRLLACEQHQTRP